VRLHELLGVAPTRSGSSWIIDGVSYTPKEGQKMSKLDDADKLQVHRIKRVFEGVIG
jgi:hypothetical protein